MTTIPNTREQEPPFAWLERAATRHPSAIALSWDGGHYTYGELLQRVETLSSALSAELDAEGLLGTALASRRDTLVAVLAASRLGTGVFPRPDLPDAEPPAPDLAGFPVHWIRSLPGPAQSETKTSTGKGFQLLIATSGSTGKAKIVALSAANLRAAVAASKRRIALHRDDCWLCCLPLTHIGGLSIPMRCLEAGAEVRIQESFDPAALVRDLQSRRISHISLVPAMLWRLLDAWGQGRAPARLRCVLVGGGSLSTALARRAHERGWPLCVTYGMSEAASQIATDCGADAGLAPGRIGLPLPGMEVKIVDADREGIGRIGLRGPMLMAGYLSDGRLDPASTEGWHVTRDLGRLDRHGMLTVFGRADDVLVSGGEKIHPATVEAMLEQCPGVDSVLLSAVADPQWGERLVALYTGSADAEYLDAWCRRHLTGARRPRIFIHTEALPQLASGKPDRKAARFRVQAELPGHTQDRKAPLAADEAGFCEFPTQSTR